MDLSWFSMWLAPLAQVGILAFHALNYGRITRRRLTITGPADWTVHQDRVPVSGIGAPTPLTMFGIRVSPRWEILVLHLTNGWYLQKGPAVQYNNGYWTHSNCRFDRSFKDRDRSVIAIAVPAKKMGLVVKA